MRKYVLEGREPVYQPDLLVWAHWYENSTRLRTVAQTDTPFGRVSSVFTGLEPTRRGSTPPLVFETKIFGGARNGDVTWAATWEACESAHKQMVERLLADPENREGST